MSARQVHESAGSLHPGRVLVGLADRIGRHAGDRNRSLRAITETAAELLGVARASIWLYDSDHTRIECVDLFESDSGSHARGLQLKAEQFPAYFAALEQARIIDADDAHTDPRTSEFSKDYLRPLGIGAMLDAPIRVGGEMIGVVCHEHVGEAREWTGEERALAATMGDFVALSTESAKRARSEEERQKIEARLARAQKMEALGRLAGGIAHDFNNLLTAVQGSLELLRFAIDRGKLDQQFLLDELRNIGLAADRAGRLTRQLSGFSRSEVVAPERVHPPTVLADMRELIRRILKPNVELHIEADPDTPWIDIDPGQLEQVILNLATNSGDAMHKGGVLEIHAGGRASSKGEEQFELTVTDDGIGIAPEVMPLIFEPFYSTKQVGVGWGLGLATVQGIIESAGGQVLVRSEPNVGTTFRIVLSAADGPGEVKAAPEEDKAIPEGRETVLLCEDDDRIREQLRDVLAEHGYEVLVAADGDAATAIAEEFGGEIHLLLTDVVMPGANGPMIAMRLRKSRPDIKVLFISGYSADSLNRNGLDASEELFLPKPFRPSDAARKVREVLDS